VTKIVVIPSVLWMRLSSRISSRRFASRKTAARRIADVGLDDDRLGNRDALLLAAGQLPRQAIST
jgi:hypothetical protein